MSSFGKVGIPAPFGDIDLGIVCPMANEEASVVSFVNMVLAECASVGFKSVTFFASVDKVSTDGTRDLLNNLASSEKSVGHRYAPMGAGTSPHAAREPDLG